MRSLGMLQPLAASDPEAQLRLSTFRQRLEELGWRDGYNVRIDYRWASGDAVRIRALAAELVSLKPDAILGASTPVVAALRAETTTIPIVSVQVIDPVAAGFVTSLARPGGNLTGITNFEFTVGGKWLETLKEILPQLARVAVLYNPKTAPYAPSLLRSIEAAAPSFAMEAINTPTQDLLRPSAQSTLSHKNQIVVCSYCRTQALYLIATYHCTRSPTPITGCVSISVFRREQGFGFVWNRCSGYASASCFYIDRILRGTKPRSFLFKHPTSSSWSINLKTAKALGLEIPPTLLARADEVIE